MTTTPTSAVPVPPTASAARRAASVTAAAVGQRATGMARTTVVDLRLTPTDRSMPSSPTVRRRSGSSTAATAARTSASLGTTESSFRLRYTGATREFPARQVD